MVFNNAGAQELAERFRKFKLDETTYDELIYLKDIDYKLLSYQWNSLEYLDHDTRLIHWTDMDLQPWLIDGNPNSGIWYTYLHEFLHSERKNQQLLLDEISRGHIRPSLEYFIFNSASLSSFSLEFKIKDILFIPPHKVQFLKRGSLRKWLAPLIKILIFVRFVSRNRQPNIK